MAKHGKKSHKGKKKFKSSSASKNQRTGGFLGIELKFLDCAWNGVSINTSTDGSGGEIQPSSGCTSALSVPAQGDGESNRDGRKYVIKGIFASGCILTTPNQNQTDVSDQGGFYLALVLDTQANGATIVSENVYVNPSSALQSIAPQPLRNLQNSKRFRVLDHVYVDIGGMYASTDGTNTASTSNMNSPTFKLSWRGSLSCTSTGTTANVSAASDNAIHLIGYNTGGMTSTLSGKSRMRFVG